jgi:ubiquinone/menaquinone biosynthesis C-methylase UbiE
MKDQPDNPDQPDNLIAVQQQFRRQAEAYSTMKVVTDPRILDNMVEVSEVRADSRVLDVACGPGFVAMAFAPKCRSVLGIDATDRLVARARTETTRRGISNITFTLGNVERMPFRTGEFDLATCRFAFHHFAHPREVLAEMARVLKPGARMVIVDMTTAEDPAKSDYHNRVELLCDPSPPERRAQIIEMMEASLAADRSGLKVRRQDGQIWFSHTGVTYALDKPIR